MLIFFAYPLVMNTWMSFTEFTNKSFLTGKAPWVGLENYVKVLASPIFGTALINTVLFTVVSVAGQIMLGMLIALMFQKKFPGQKWMSTAMLLPWLLPLIVTATLWRWMLQQDGAINQLLAAVGLPGDSGWLSDPGLALGAVLVVNIWLGLPFTVTIFGAGLSGVDRQVYEAANLDGAGPWRMFWNITLPSIRPVLSVVLILGIIFTLKVLDLVLIMTGGGPANSTQTLGLLSYTASFQQFRYGEGAAIGNILVLVTVAFAFAYVRMTRKNDEEFAS
jgi:multiple sugar transport system permease protein